MTHLFVIALEIKMTDMFKQTVPVQCVELVNANQGVKQISWALGEQSEHTALQLLQLGARLQKKKTTKNPIKHRFGKDGCDSTAVGKAACLNRVSKFLWKGFSHFPTEFAGRNHNNMIHVCCFFFFFTAPTLRT